jgi:G3E family GTPase
MREERAGHARLIVGWAALPSGDPRMPVTIVTGWLGAGKTTLLNRVLREPRGLRWAVLVNEFGAISIDHRLVLRSDERMVELANGCVCCTVRGDLVEALGRLRRRRPPFFRRPKFDRVLIETTGLAEPAPLLRTFLVEAGVSVSYVVESVLTLVDAAHAEAALSEHAAQEQIALADLLVLNKADRADAATRAKLRNQLSVINPAAPIIEAVRGEIPLDEILLHRSNPNLRALDAGPAHEHEAHDTHGIGSVALQSPVALDELKAQLWLSGAVKLMGPRLIRFKGFLHLADRPYRGVLQGVYDLYTVEAGLPWLEGEPRLTEIVFIGRGLDRAFLERGLAACAAR